MSTPPGDRERLQSSADVLDAIGLVIVLAPLAIGAVHIEARLALAAIAAATAAYVWLRPKAMLPTINLIGWTALAWLALSLLVLIPLSPTVVATLSSEAAETYTTAAALTDGEVRPSLSPDRPRSASMLLTLVIYGLIAITVWGRALEASPHESARSRLPLYVVFAGALSAVVALAHTVVDAHNLYGLYTPLTSLNTQPLRGPMVNSNHTAALLLLTTCVTFGFLLRVREQRRAVLLAGVWITMVAAIVLSASRANLALLAVTHGYLFWHVRRESAHSKQRLMWIVFGGVALIGGLILTAGDTWTQSLQSSTKTEAMSLPALLIDRWTTGWHVLLEQPWLGHGPGIFGVVAPRHTTSWLDGYMNRAHNLPLQLATEWGVPVALCLLAIGGWWLVRLLKRTYHRPSHHAAAIGLAAIVCQNMVDFSLLIPGVGVAWIVTGTWLSTTAKSSRTERTSWTWARALTVLACIAILGPLGLVAYEGSPARADAAIRTAAPTEAWRDTLNRSLRLHPADFHLHTLGSAVARSRGEAGLAHQLAQRALTLAPLSPDALGTAAKSAFAAGERDAGRQALEALCQRPPAHGPECLAILVSERHQEGLIAEVVGTDAELTLALAEYLRQRGHREAMTKVLTWGRHQFPDQLQVQEALVAAWLRVPKAGKALDSLSVDILARSAEETDPKVQRRMQRLGYLIQGRLMELENRNLEARHLYQEAAALDPKRAREPLFRAATVLYRLEDMERLDRVLDSLEGTLEARDRVSRVAYHRLRSRAYRRVGQLREAVNELHKAIRLRPRDATLYEALSSALAALGDERGAKRATEQANTFRRKI